MELILTLLVVLVVSVRSQSPNVEIELNGNTFFGSSSISGAVIFEEQFGFDAKSVKLLYPDDELLQDGCTAFNNTLDGEFVVLFDRGGCTFNEKVQTAQSLGAISVLISNQDESIFNSTSGELRNVCDLDCDISKSKNKQSCESNSDCNSNTCFLTLASAEDKEQTFCCFTDPLINMPVTNSDNNDDDIVISAIFIGLIDGERVVNSLSTSETDGFSESSINMKERFRFEVDPSVLILILLGTGSVAIASYIAGKNDRELVSILWGTKPKFLKEQEEERQMALRGGGKEEGYVEEVESVELTVSQAVGMLICASVFLLVLFFLVRLYPQQIVIGIIVFFGLGAIYSTSYFFVRPIIRKILPKKASFCMVYTPSWSQYVFEERYTFESLLGFVITVGMVVCWFIFRHEREKVWYLQNLFSVAVALLFLSSIRLNTLKTGFYLLVGFCIYDIFMVFITPFFGAGSVMLEVATAGRGGESVDNVEIGEVQAEVCERIEDEQMPMLFLAPRFDYRGGFGLLGLGDVLIPGIFITYIIRTDYYYAASRIHELMRETNKQVTEVGPSGFAFIAFMKAHFYFFSSIIAYLVALIITFIANLQGWTINGVQGQPALLYIVPFVMITFLLQLGSSKRKFLWNKSLADLMSGEEPPTDGEGGDLESEGDVKKVTQIDAKRKESVTQNEAEVDVTQNTNTDEVTPTQEEVEKDTPIEKKEDPVSI